MSATKSAAPLLSFLVITLACFLFYSKTLGFEFVWDDFGLIVKSDALRTWSSLGKFFTTPYWILATGELAPYHRPMAPMLILLTSSFSGTQPWGYHLVSVLLFSLTAFVFFEFLKEKFGFFIAAAACAVFILHPVNVETVSWVCCQPTILSGLCFVLILWMSSRLTAENSKKILPVIGLVYFLALMSYHSILTLPFLIFFLDCFDSSRRHARPWKLRIREYSVYFFLTLLFMLYNQGVIYLYAGTFQIRPFYVAANSNLVYSGSTLDFFFAPINSLFRYSELLLFPYRLSPDAYFKAADIPLSAAASFGFLLLATLLLPKSPGKKVSVLWMSCGLLSVLNLVPQGGLFADRYLFISVMGYSLFAALAFENLRGYLQKRTKQYKLFIFAIGFGILLLLGSRAWKQMDLWQNDFSYWYHASRITPEKARNHYFLGTWWEKLGNYREAAEEYQKTIDLDSNEDLKIAVTRLAEVKKQLPQAT